MPAAHSSVYAEAMEASMPLPLSLSADEIELWRLMNEHNWDDSFALPLAVVCHPSCDRALALRLFWELDDAAQIHLSDEQNALTEHYSTQAKYQPEEFERIRSYADRLVSGLRDEAFPDGRNEFDTGFMSAPHLVLTEQQLKLRNLRTKRAKMEFADQFIRPAWPHL